MPGARNGRAGRKADRRHARRCEAHLRRGRGGRDCLLWSGTSGARIRSCSGRRRWSWPGKLGRPVCLTAMSTWLKPAEYFETAWRRSKGGGPILINLIHDIDQLRFLFGDIATVQAMTSNVDPRIRSRGHGGHPAAIPQWRLGNRHGFRHGAAPWNWDLSAGEAERFPQAGRQFALPVGDRRLADVAAPRTTGTTAKARAGTTSSRRSELRCTSAILTPSRCATSAPSSKGEEEPVCSADDAMRSLEATLAVATAAATGNPVGLPSSREWMESTEVAAT